MTYLKTLKAPLLLSLGIFLFTLVPYLLGYIQAPTGKTFNGFFYIADDSMTYLSKMKEGALGAWGWSDLYISHPIANQVPVFEFYILWGHICSILNIPLIVGYHLARLSGILALVFATYRLSFLFFDNKSTRRLAILLVLFGSGIGYVVLLLHSPVIFGQQLEALDLHLPELSGFYSMLAIPHFAWAAALLGFSLLAIFKVGDEGDGYQKSILQLSVSLLALTFIHPQMIVIIGALAFCYLTLKKASRMTWIKITAPFLLCAPLLYYDLILLTKDPVISQWSQQWKHQAPEFLSMILALGIPFGLALWVMVKTKTYKSPKVATLVVWVVIVLVLLYLPNPINIQRRLLDGLFIPVGILATMALEFRLRLRKYLVPICIVSSLIVWGIGIDWSLAQEPFLFIDSNQIEAVNWLGQQPLTFPSPAVLSTSSTGLYIPPISGDRVFVGHYSETLNFLETSRMANLEIKQGGSQLAYFMKVHGIKYLFWGPNEKVLGGSYPNAENFTIVYQNREVSIFTTK